MNGIVFDIGGVVIHDQGLKTKVQAAFPSVSTDRLWQSLNVALLPACRGEASLLTCWQRLAAELAVSPPATTLAGLWDTADFVDGIKINHEVIELVRSLRQRYKLGVVSNTLHEHAVALQEMGIYEEFDEVILSHEVGLTKNDERIFQVALSRLELEPQEAIFIDDFAAYVEVARSVGMQSILYTNASALTASLKNLGVR